MTYERSEIIAVTIQKIMAQSFPPEKLLIVDNSETDKTYSVILQLNDSRLQYFRVGYNAGPAGAAKIGLQKLTEEGYDWIYWGDDDNPPDFIDSFERLLNLVQSYQGKVGVVGAVGQFFIPSKGEIVRVPDKSLTIGSSINVDSIAGGQCMIVNADVVQAGVLPRERFFFGFEELDFCLNVKKAGFDLVVSSELFLRARAKYGKLNFRRPTYTKKRVAGLSREYYSTRNMLFILNQNRLTGAYWYQLLKSIIKSIYGFRFGIEYGYQNGRMILQGIYDSITGKMGKKF